MKDFPLHIYHYLLSRFWGEEIQPRSFRGAYAKSKSILVIAPPELSAAEETINCIKSFAETGKRITILIYHEVRYKYPNDHRLKYEEYFKPDILLGIFPKFPFLHRLRRLKYDLVVDLDFSGNNFNSFLTLAVQAPYKAGLGRDYYESTYSICFQKREESKPAIVQNYVDLLYSL